MIFRRIRDKDIDRNSKRLLNLLLLVTIILVITATIVLWVTFGGPIWQILTRILFVLLVPPFIGFIGATITAPLHEGLQRLRINRTVSAVVCTALLILLMFSALVGIIWAGIMALSQLELGMIEDGLIWINENTFVNINLEGDFWQTIIYFFQENDFMLDFLSTAAIFELLSSVFGVVGNLIIVFSIFPFYMFFMLRNPQIVKSNVRRIIPEGYVHHYDALAERFVMVNRGYIAGTLYESFFMFLSTLALYYLLGLALWAAGIEHNAFLTWAPILFATIVAVTQVVPYVGAVVGAIPPIVYGAVVYLPLDLWWPIFAILGINIFVQLVIDNFLLRPWLFGKAISVHPLLLVSGILVTTVLFGFWGILLSVAILGFAKEAVLYAYKVWREEKERHERDEKADEKANEKAICEKCEQ
ncbi:MAG: AI-2E family transporter [Firmicutes bacterium]|nr:AI-2E family transporter [Bacillota bacterium]